MSNVLNRLFVHIKNVGVVRGLGISLHRYLVRLLNPGASFVWGSLGEDALLWFYFTEVLAIRRTGYYVDVGCNDPVSHSNTWRLYQLGWNGLCIDADHEVTRRFDNVRSRDKVATALVSDAEQDLDFHVFDGSVVSSVDPDHIEAWKKSGRVLEVRRLRTKTLNAIFEENSVPQSFDLLRIDVEGHDAAVLRSVDLNKYQPLMILIEMHGETVDAVVKSEIFIRLTSYGYKMVSLAGYNGIFLRQEAN